MKQFVHPTAFNPFTFIKRNPKLHTALSIFLVIAFLHLTTACSYYKVGEMTTTKKEFGSKIDKFNKTGHYAIIHSNGYSWHLKNLEVNLESSTIKGKVDSINTLHTYKKPRDIKGANKFKLKKQFPVEEMHFQLNSTIVPNYGTDMIIPFETIESISLNKRDGGTEAAYLFLGAIGVLVGLTLLVFALKSSCPFAYVWTEEGYVFMGELYPGMITENMQIDDYLPLGSYDLSTNQFVVKVTNELKEVQHTDALELIAITHPDEVEVLLDDQGNYYTLTNLIPPQQVIIDNIEEDMTAALYKDDIAYTFNTQDEMVDSRRNITMEFNVPNDQNDGKLLLRAKNSLWLDYMFGQFNQKFGSLYKQFQSNQQQTSGEESRQWISDQDIPLSIYVETNTGWELIKSINTVGPLKYRDLVIPVERKYLANNTVNIKVETGFMFWEVDYIAIDFSPQLDLNISVLAPEIATDQNDLNVTKLLSETDKTYLIQPNIGDEVVVEFQSEILSQGHQSLFLRNRGYYNYIRDYKGTPDIQSLKSFKEKNQFTLYSMLEYYSLMGMEAKEDVAGYE